MDQGSRFHLTLNSSGNCPTCLGPIVIPGNWGLHGKTSAFDSVTQPALSTFCAPDTVPPAGNIAVNKVHKISTLSGEVPGE